MPGAPPRPEPAPRILPGFPRPLAPRLVLPSPRFSFVPIVTLRDVHLGRHGAPLLDGIECHIEAASGSASSAAARCTFQPAFTAETLAEQIATFGRPLQLLRAGWCCPYRPSRIPANERSSSSFGQCSPNGEISMRLRSVSSADSRRGLPLIGKLNSWPLANLTKMRPLSCHAFRGRSAKVFGPFLLDEFEVVMNEFLRSR